MKRYCNLCGIDVEFTVYKGDENAVLRGNSHAVLRENSHAELLGNSHAECRSPYACGILKSIAAECIGRSIGDKPIPPKVYLKSCGVKINKGLVLLYKSTRPDGSSYNTSTVKYVIGVETVAPDWDPDFKDECGKGLHLSPTIQQAASFDDSDCYFACSVKVEDIAPLPPYAQYPDKIRVRACTPLYLVNNQGEKITEREGG